MKKAILSIALGLTFSLNASAALIASYEFDGNANDSSGNGFHGAVSGATLTNDRYGQSNNAYSFDGNADAIYIPNSTLNNRDIFSVSLWFQTNDLASSLLSGANSSSANEFLLFIGNSGTVDGYFHSSPPQAVSPVANNNLWNHLVVSYEQGQVTSYFNGGFFGANSFSNAPIEIGINGLILGREQDTLNGGFDLSQDLLGKIDEVNIYSHILSSSEIQNLYSPSSVPAPAAIWLLSSGLIGLIGMRKKSAKLSANYA